MRVTPPVARLGKPLTLTAFGMVITAIIGDAAALMPVSANVAVMHKVTRSESGITALTYRTSYGSGFRYIFTSS